MGTPFGQLDTMMRYYEKDSERVLDKNKPIIVRLDGVFNCLSIAKKYIKKI